MTPYQHAVVAALRDVAGERRELDEDLRADVDDLVVPACQAAVDRATSTTVARELEALGYAVDVAFDADPPAHLVVTHEKWGAAHRVDIDVRRGELNARFSTDENAASPAWTDLFKAAWADDVDTLRANTAEHGVTSGAVWMTDDPRKPDRPVVTDTGLRRRGEPRERAIPHDDL